MRGCNCSCENCILPVEYGNKFRFRDIDKVIHDIESIDYTDIFITDDSLSLYNKQCFSYVAELMNRTAKLECKPRFFMSASLKMSTDKDYLNTLVKGGTVCIYLVTGCDLYSIKAFQHNGQRFFDWGLEIVKKLQEAGHHVYISHGLGFDFQDNYVFDAALEFSQKANIETTEFYIFIPFPQTPSWHRLRKENRILHYNWTKYNTANVVFKPKNLTEQELLDGFIYCWKEFLYEHTVEETLNFFTNDISRNI